MRRCEMTIDDIMYYSMDEYQRVMVYLLTCYDGEVVFDGYMQDEEFEQYRDCEVSTWDITTDGAICFNI